MSVRSIIRFKVKQGREQEFESAFKAGGNLTRPVELVGYIKAELVKCASDPSEYYVIGEWADAAAYAAWQEKGPSEAPAGTVERLMDVLVDFEPGKLFDVIDAGYGTGHSQ